MPTYRVYLMKNNKLARWEDIEAPHDIAAIEGAQRFRGDCHVELWFERRKITSFEPSGEALEPFLLASS